MKLIGFFCLLVFAILGNACGGTQNTNNATANSASPPAPKSPQPTATLDELASGRKLYEINCANCHKDNGSGGEVTIEGRKLNPDNLTSAKIKGFSDDKIIGFMIKGIEDEGMPSFKGKLSEAEMRDIVKFVRVEIQKMPVTAAPAK